MILSDFLNIPWMPGIDQCEVSEHQGLPARILHVPGMESITEFLVSKSEIDRKLVYGVLRSTLMPIDEYRAEVTVSEAPDGCTVQFEGSFNADGSEFEQIEGLLTGAYQMMAEAIDQYLSGEEPSRG